MNPTERLLHALERERTYYDKDPTRESPHPVPYRDLDDPYAMEPPCVPKGANPEGGDRMIEHSDELKDLAAALAKAQTQVKGAAKDSLNPHFKSHYADLASVWEACRKPLTENGLSVIQLPGYEDRTDGALATLTTMVLHSSGQWIRETAKAPLTKADAQGVGSVLTYLRRYALAAVASVAPEDDDGNAASPVMAPERPRHVTQYGEMVLPGGPTKWDGHGSKPLSQVPSDTLIKARDWLAKRDAGANDALIGAINDVLDQRSRDDLADPLWDAP